MDVPFKVADRKQLKKFYAQWSITASKLIQKYAKDNSLKWYNIKWRNKSKEIPFYIRTKAPNTFLGNIWFASSPVNYAYDKDSPKLKTTYKAIPKKIRKKPVNANGKWFIPKKYKPDIYNINRSLIEPVDEPVRFFASKTSHNKTHKYKKPLLWYHSKDTNEIAPVTLRKQLADEIYHDPETAKLILEAFETCISKFHNVFLVDTTN